MILAGFKLMFLGMAVVYFFLMLLILSMKISYRFLSKVSARELAEAEASELHKKRRSLPKVEEDKVLVAVISAAVAAHRSRSKVSA